MNEKTGNSETVKTIISETIWATEPVEDIESADQLAQDIIDQVAANTAIIPFTEEEAIVLLETARIALADEEIMLQVGSDTDLTYNFLIDLHDKLVAWLEKDPR